jgi:hypothetical protein
MIRSGGVRKDQVGRVGLVAQTVVHSSSLGGSSSTAHINCQQIKKKKIKNYEFHDSLYNMITHCVDRSDSQIKKKKKKKKLTKKMQGGIYPHREHESNQMVLEGHEAPVAEASLALFLFLP